MFSGAISAAAGASMLATFRKVPASTGSDQAAAR